MNGAAGERRNGLWVMDLTVKGTPARPAASDRASASPSTTTDPGDVRAPRSSKSRPDASATPSTPTRAAVKDRGVPSGAAADSGAVKVASMPHHPAERKAIRDRSRSTTIRVATLWTRPADSRGMIFFHSTGDTS